MTEAIVAGAGFGVAVLLLVRALGGARPSIADRLAAVDRAAAAGPAAFDRLPQGWPSSAGTGAPAVVRGVQAALGSRFGRWLVDPALAADLELLGIDAAAHTARKVAAATATLAVAPLVLSAAAAALGLPWPFGAWTAVLAAVAVFLAADRRVKAAAAARRRDFLSTLTVYLDLVAMRAASGSGVSEALRDAAAIGSGYPWRRLRAALEDARLDGRPPSAGLVRLGADIAVAELTELGAQLDLVDATGAQAEATLRAKAEALRDRHLTDLHGDANARSQTMVVGQVLLGVGFLTLIGYPALAAVLAL